MSDAEIRADERRKVLIEVAAMVDDFGWVLPLYEDKQVNLASDDAACEVCSQIARKLKSMAGESAS
jgi:hypothetical protein